MQGAVPPALQGLKVAPNGLLFSSGKPLFELSVWQVGNLIAFLKPIFSRPQVKSVPVAKVSRTELNKFEDPTQSGCSGPGDMRTIHADATFVVVYVLQYLELSPRLHAC